MRENPVKARLANGETVFGTMVFEFLSPGLPAILAEAGAAFAFYDMEHSGFSVEDMKTQFALCRGLDLVPLVRPPGKSYQYTARLLDLGAMGLVYQMVESVEEAEELVRWNRYPPAGVRGAMFGGAHDDYVAGSVPEVIAGAHERTLVCVLIETAKGLENADEIAAVPGVDVVHLGQSDLSLSLGVPGNIGHPQVQAGIDRILQACERNGRTPGCVAMDVAQAREWMARGFRMVSYSYDIALLGGALKAGIQALSADG